MLMSEATGAQSQASDNDSTLAIPEVADLLGVSIEVVDAFLHHGVIHFRMSMELREFGARTKCRSVGQTPIFEAKSSTYSRPKPKSWDFTIE